MPQIVKYVGKKTAYYNDRSYFPGEVFEAPDQIPVRDPKGRPKIDPKTNEPIMRPLVFNEHSSFQLVSEEEKAEYIRSNPRAARREENEEIIDKRALKRPYREGKLSSKELRARGLPV